jgi:hypothetical protein
MHNGLNEQRELSQLKKIGATTLSITALGRTTLDIQSFIATLDVATLSIDQIYAEFRVTIISIIMLCHNAECHNAIMLNAIMLNAIMLNVIMLNVINRNVIMLNTTMLSVVMLNVII